MSLWVRVAVFLAVSFAVSWGWWLWLLAQGLSVEPGSPASHLPGLIGPLVGAFAAAALTEGRGAVAALARSLVRRPARPGLALAAILAPAGLAAAIVALRVAAGAPPPASGDFLAYPGLWPALATPAGLVAVVLLNGYGEEAGWRGWLFPRLAARFGATGATLATAAVWLFWHAPLFWLNASMAALVGPMLAGWAVALVLGAFLLNWLWLETGGSVAVLALWHVSYNLAVATPAAGDLGAAGVSAAVMACGAAVAVAWLRHSPPPGRIAAAAGAGGAVTSPAGCG
jgi:membrane protease YdiL (CAAX protease family)